MSNLIRNCAIHYLELNKYYYRLRLGRKGKTEEITVVFDKENFYHLAGLHYLDDVASLKSGREKIFEKLVQDNDFSDIVQSSTKFGMISDRVELVTELEKLLDGEFRIFKYSYMRNVYSNIQADYCINFQTEKGSVFLFLEHDKKLNYYFCKSIFYQHGMDYTRNQSRMTVLSVEKFWKDN